jgi:putative ABC transport system substrate-binding protein
MVQQKPAVIAVSSSTAIALAVKAATSTIPIVFCVGGDPVKNGLVASLNRPGGNVTGISYLSNLLAPKRLELLGELDSKHPVVAHLVNLRNVNAKADTDEMSAAARAVDAKLCFSKLATQTNSRQRSLQSRNKKSARLSSLPIPYFSANALMSLHCRHGTKLQRYLTVANTPTRAVSSATAPIVLQRFARLAFA